MTQHVAPPAGGLNTASGSKSLCLHPPPLRWLVAIGAADSGAL
eukprot:gene12531-biopygen9413